jgi:hypothetical protein
MSDQKVDEAGAPGKDAAPSTPAEKTFENEGGAGPAAEPAAPASLMEKVEHAIGAVRQRFTGSGK